MRMATQSVRNEYNDDDARFTIRANSTIPSSLHQSSKVIFDTGASVHVANTEAYMQHGLTPNTSFTVVGVNGTKDKAACSHTGGLSMSIRAYTYDNEPCIIKVDGSGMQNALLCRESPLTLVAWAEMKKAGWLMMPDGNGLFHPEAQLCIWYEFANGDGSLYIPTVDPDEVEDDERSVCCGSPLDPPKHHFAPIQMNTA